MILVHAIGRVIVCLFIVGGVWGDIAQAAPDIGKHKDLIDRIINLVSGMADPGRYIGVKGGISTAVDGTFNDPLIVNAGTGIPVGEASVNTKMASPVYLVASGARTSWGRFEVEFSYRENKVRDFNFKEPIGQVQVGGGLQNMALMANLLYELKFDSTAITPYLLGGLGLSYVKHEVTSTEEGGSNAEVLSGVFDPSRGDTARYAEEKFMFAYQGGAGIRYPIFENLGKNKKGALNLDVSYRWFGTPEVEFGTRNNMSGEEGSLTFKNTHHTGMFGLVLDF